MAISFGSDPEFMLQHKGEFVSAIGILPAKGAGSCSNSSFYYDNVLAECTIVPAWNKEDVIENIRTALEMFARFVKPAVPVIQAAQNYPSSQLENPAAREAGCKPEWCVYTMKLLKPIQGIISDTPLRTAGGHIHLGSNSNSVEESVLKNQFYFPALVMMLDLFVGLPSVFLDQDPTSVVRRKAYGLAGRHRVPAHGLEYRTLSNFWFASPKLVSLIYDLTIFAVNFVQDDKFDNLWRVEPKLLASDDPSQAYQCFGYDADKLRHCINTCDRKEIKKSFEGLLSEYLPDDLRARTLSLMHEKFEPLLKEWQIES